MFDHFGYGHPPYDSWSNLTWYSLDRTLQWLSAQRVRLNPEGCVPHLPRYQEMDAITIPLARASMAEIHGLHLHPFRKTSSTHSASASSSTPSASELAESGGTIPSSPPAAGPIFVTSDNDEPEKPQSPPKESQSPSPKVKSSLKIQSSLKSKQKASKKSSPFKTPKTSHRRPSSTKTILKVKLPVTSEARPSQTTIKPLPDPNHSTQQSGNQQSSTSPSIRSVVHPEGVVSPPNNRSVTELQHENDSEPEPQYESNSDSSDMD